MSKTKRLPTRKQVRKQDTWDLATLYADDAAWDKEFRKWEKRIPKFEKFRGTLGKSAKQLAECLKFDTQFDRVADRLGTYAFLRTAEDTADGDAQSMLARFSNAGSRAQQAASFIQPEIMAIADTKMKRFQKSKELADYSLLLERWLRFKPHTLSDQEEKLLAMQSEMASTAGQVFRQLHDADLKFGMIEDASGNNIELSHSSFSACLNSSKRSVRKRAFHQYYEQIDGHRNTLAASLRGSIQGDVFRARARGFESAREASLFSDNVPASVYDNLIASVHKHLPGLYRYYEVRQRRMRLKKIHHYDTYVPILSKLEVKHSWSQAVDLVVEALAPLGSNYCEVLEEGLKGRWCDRYENQGKQSGAFSSGAYDGDPFILMNYQSDVLSHVFTLAHEAGHSMHTWHSKTTQPMQYYQYTIFVAEVASTFNEQLLSRYLLERATDKQQKAYLINREIDAIRGTIIRQTMFAEFEKITHAMADNNEPLTLDAFKAVYRGLLETYFGPDFTLDDELSLECLRIPHFYRAFYVYKYATGLSAAIALAERVLSGGEAELNDYLNFLKGGSSKYSLDLLKDAGVDMRKPKPVDTALKHFDQLVEELDELL